MCLCEKFINAPHMQNSLESSSYLLVIGNIDYWVAVLLFSLVYLIAKQMEEFRQLIDDCLRFIRSTGFNQASSVILLFTTKTGK